MANCCEDGDLCVCLRPSSATDVGQSELNFQGASVPAEHKASHASTLPENKTDQMDDKKSDKACTDSVTELSKTRRAKKRKNSSEEVEKKSSPIELENRYPKRHSSSKTSMVLPDLKQKSVAQNYRDEQIQLRNKAKCCSKEHSLVAINSSVNTPKLTKKRWSENLGIAEALSSCKRKRTRSVEVPAHNSKVLTMKTKKDAVPVNTRSGSLSTLNRRGRSSSKAVKHESIKTEPVETRVKKCADKHMELDSFLEEEIVDKKENSLFECSVNENEASMVKTRKQFKSEAVRKWKKGTKDRQKHTRVKIKSCSGLPGRRKANEANTGSLRIEVEAIRKEKQKYARLKSKSCSGLPNTRNKNEASTGSQIKQLKSEVNAVRKERQKYARVKSKSFNGFPKRRKVSVNDLRTLNLGREHLEDSVDETGLDAACSTSDMEECHNKEDSLYLLDLSLPTPQPLRNPSPNSSSYDPNMDASDSDSDEDLPVGITPLKKDQKFSENDIVWVKWKTCITLPARVTHVYPKKRRLTYIVFVTNEHFTAGYQNVILFCDPEKDKIMEAAATLKEEDRKFFNKCLDEAENYIAAQALKALPEQQKPPEVEAAAEQTEPSEGRATASGPLETEPENMKKERSAGIRKKLNEDVAERRKLDKKKVIVTRYEKGKFTLSKRGQLRLQKMAEKNKSLVDFLISEETKIFLASVYRRELHSDLHEAYVNGTVRDRAKLKHKGFGPLDDETQIELVLNTYLEWLMKLSQTKLPEVDYVFDVWIPEAIVHALQKKKCYSKKKAWEQFNKGVRRTKEELLILHQDLMDCESVKTWSTKPKELFL